MEALELQVDAAAQCVYEHRLAEPRRTFEQDMPAREKGDDQELYGLILTEELRAEPLSQLVHFRSQGFDLCVEFVEVTQCSI